MKLNYITFTICSDHLVDDKNEVEIGHEKKVNKKSVIFQVILKQKLKIKSLILFGAIYKLRNPEWGWGKHNFVMMLQGWMMG